MHFIAGVPLYEKYCGSLKIGYGNYILSLLEDAA